MTSTLHDQRKDGAIQEEWDDLEAKRGAIATACQERDVERLIALADSKGGLLEDGFRATAWPLLLGCTEKNLETTIDEGWQDLPEHSDEEQVQKDVDRAFVYYPTNETEKSLEHKRKALFDLIVKILRFDPMLHYFQGYHDIAQVVLLVLGEQAALNAVTRISLLRIRDYMLSSLSPATKHLLLIPAILSCADNELALHLSRTDPYFALSAVLTLYAHDIEEYTDIVRLYDFILAHEPVLTIYLFAALIVSRRDELLAFESHDSDMLLFTLSKLPRPLNLQLLIDKSLEIFNAYPPEKLPGRSWHNISAYSVLKTSRQRPREQTLDEARIHFRKQSNQLDREQMTAKLVKQLQKNRRPIVSFGATLMAGVLAYYLRRNGTDRLLWAALWRVTHVFYK